MRGHEAFADSLKRLSLLPVFGNPGTTELSSLRSIEDYVLTQFDGLAVGMADGLSQISSVPQVVNLHTILGLGNSMAYIYTAKKNRSPIVITAGQQDLRHEKMEPLLWGNLVNFVGDNVKFKYEVRNASEIPGTLRKAKMEALTAPVGPTFVSLPSNLMDDELSYVPPEDIKIEEEARDGTIEDLVAEAINGSKSPAIVFGWEIDFYDAFTEAEKVAEKIGCPVYAEPLAHRSPFRSIHRQFAGNLLPATTLINLRLLENDLVVVIGGDMILYPYFPSPLLNGKRVIFIGKNIEPKFGEFHKTNLKNFLKGLEDKVEKKGSYSKPVDYSLATRIVNEREKMGPAYVMSKIKKEFSDYVIVDEAISNTPTLRDVIGYQPQKYFTSKSGQLGWASPAAAGMSMKYDKVLAIVGEGSFMYSVQILWTVKNYDLPVKYIILRNGGYSILKSYSMSYYQGVEKKKFLSFDLPVDKIAESYGIETRVATNELEELKWLREGSSPKLLVIDMDRSIPKLFL